MTFDIDMVIRISPETQNALPPSTLPLTPQPQDTVEGGRRIRDIRDREEKLESCLEDHSGGWKEIFDFLRRPGKEKNVKCQV